MTHDTQLLAALVLPFLVLVLLRINAALVFLSLCLGYVVVELVAKDANSLVRFLAPDAGVSQTTWQLILLLLPPVVTAVIMVFSMKGRLKTVLNVLPAAATSVLAVILAVPLLTSGLRFSLQRTEVWWQVSEYQSIIVGLGAAISLLFLWMQRRKAKKEE